MNGDSNKAVVKRASLTGSESNEEFIKRESGRTINFAEKLHLVLSNAECQGKLAVLVIHDNISSCSSTY
jgi:hypothetical protein